MLEHIPQAFYYFEVHILYASLVCLIAWALTSLPVASATTKYWLWVATSLNFIFPVAATVDWIWSAHLTWASPIGPIGDIGVFISEDHTIAGILCVVWLCGAAFMSVRLLRRIRNEQRDYDSSSLVDRQNQPSFFKDGVQVRFTANRRPPIVDGIFRPYILLPRGIDSFLSSTELHAVLLHELRHAKRRDNLIRLIHEAGLCVLWFHPLMWLAGAQMALYRELSCDESVIQSAGGEDLVSALAKLADPDGGLLLQASAVSFMGHRLLRLKALRPLRSHHLGNAAMAVFFAAAVATGVYGTVSHTACCFVTRVAEGATCARR